MCPNAVSKVQTLQTDTISGRVGRNMDIQARVTREVRTSSQINGLAFGGRGMAPSNGAGKLWPKRLLALELAV